MPRSRFDLTQFREAYDLHMRVAHLLKEDAWRFAHEYQTPCGNLDFVAVHPDTGAVRIIECKRRVESVSELIYQLWRYNVGVGYPAASKYVYTLAPITRETAHTLISEGIHWCQMELNVPRGSYGNRSDNLRQFLETMDHFHPWYKSRHPASTIKD